MRYIKFLPVLLMLGVGCVPPGHAPRPPRPPKPPTPPHGAVQFTIPDSSFASPVVALNYKG